MEYMGVLGFIFGIFGVMAYTSMGPLKRRIEALEGELANTKGTSYHEDRAALVKAAEDYIGKKVKIELKEDHEDSDIISYGNSKYGSNTVLDVDSGWLKIHIESPKGDKDKLIRLESIQSITEDNH